jgi:predicted RNA methylase
VAVNVVRKRDVDNDTLTVLAQLQVQGYVVLAHPQQLDRKLYDKVNAALEAIGGKWNRKAKGHVFAEDPGERLADIVATGSYTCPRLNGYFPTPPDLARLLAEELVTAVGTRPTAHGPSPTYLEPSAGDGALARALVDAGVPRDRVLCVELDAGRVEKLSGQGFTVVRGDFLEVTDSILMAEPVGAILMNPPFNGGADARHLNTALDVLLPGGCLRAIVSAGVIFRETAIHRRVRERVNALGGWWEHLPDGTFSEAGTDVRTAVVRVG